MNRYLIMIVCFLALTRNASALSTNVLFNCAVDYFDHCSQYPVNSKELETCFRRVGKNLKPYCIDALKKEGLVTEEDKEPISTRLESISESAQNVDPISSLSSMDQYYREHQNDEITQKTIIASEGNDIVKKTITTIRDGISTRIKIIQKKLKDEVTKKKIDPVNSVVVKERKVQKGGKWDGYPLYLEWKDRKREMGGELSLYGYEDRN